MSTISARERRETSFPHEGQVNAGICAKFLQFRILQTFSIFQEHERTKNTSGHLRLSLKKRSLLLMVAAKSNETQTEAERTLKGVPIMFYSCFRSLKFTLTHSFHSDALRTKEEEMGIKAIKAGGTNRWGPLFRRSLRRSSSRASLTHVSRRTCWLMVF